MCVTNQQSLELLPVSRCGAAGRRPLGPVHVAERAWLRVLRVVSPRGGPRSVDRGCAGRNATSVKEIEPRQSTNFRCGADDAVFIFKTEEEEAQAFQAALTERTKVAGLNLKLVTSEHRAERKQGRKEINTVNG